MLIQYAYQVGQFQIAGAPDWVKFDRYDLAAKTEGDPPIDQLRFLLQRLLADRFQLRQHWETREAAVYELAVSKPENSRRPDPATARPMRLRGGLRNTPGHTKGYKLTGGDVAGSLTFFLGRLVVDKTGLSGRYDVELEWMPDSVQMQSSPVESSAPSIFTAVQDQLGLKLKPAQGPVPTLVIDGVERPLGTKLLWQSTAPSRSRLGNAVILGLPGARQQLCLRMRDN